MSKNNNKSVDEIQENSIEKRLDTIISLLLNPKISEDSFAKKIEHLTKMSFSNDEIAKLLQTTKNSIGATKYKKPTVKK